MLFYKNIIKIYFMCLKMKIIIKALIVPIIRLQYLRNFSVLYSTTSIYQEDQIKIGKYNINYLKVGHGVHRVLCIPGALGSIWTDFKPQVEGFDREKFTLVVWDAPGYGKSRPPEREFHEDYYGQDVDSAVEFMKALNIPKFSVMGWCYGAITSILLAAKHPDAVHKLVVWGARSHILPHEHEFSRKLEDLDALSENIRIPKIELYGKERFSKLWAKVLKADNTVYRDKKGIIFFPDVLKNVSCPTFILHGEKDPLVDKSHVPYLQSCIQGSRTYLYPDGKHNIHLRYADDFNQRVQTFLLER